MVARLVNTIFIRPNTTVIILYMPSYYVPGVFESLIEKAGGVAMDWHQKGDPLVPDPKKLHRSAKIKAMETKYVNPPVQEIVSLVKKAAGTRTAGLLSNLSLSNTNQLRWAQG